MEDLGEASTVRGSSSPELVEICFAAISLEVLAVGMNFKAGIEGNAVERLKFGERANWGGSACEDRGEGCVNIWSGERGIRFKGDLSVRGTGGVSGFGVGTLDGEGTEVSVDETGAAMKERLCDLGKGIVGGGSGDTDANEIRDKLGDRSKGGVSPELEDLSGFVEDVGGRICLGLGVGSIAAAIEAADM